MPQRPAYGSLPHSAIRPATDKGHHTPLLQSTDTLVVATVTTWLKSRVSASDETPLLDAFERADAPATIDALAETLNHLYETLPAQSMASILKP